MKYYLFLFVLMACSASNNSNFNSNDLLEYKINTHLVFYKYKFTNESASSECCAAYLIFRNNYNSDFINKLTSDNFRTTYKVGNEYSRGPIFFFNDLNLFEVSVNENCDSFNSNSKFSQGYIDRINAKYDSLSFIGIDTIRSFSLGNIKIVYCQDSQSFKSTILRISKE